ncbi:small glutamine-rich tetratricopeptide repeat-containing protein alpha-like [Actinia tenebrosa]|uniref:Small glutamine-rich tetratricopeptide repeat-containing protein alpha-like n=1 Tax=Actinia tenebrosa TaxID=6105 RepID=A0A6P8J2Y9_ACTTE|nr:small glutamine-rich tetratricopeptide repeat-containing protein alpha-like [Actinia tenebrosa]
MQPTAEDRVKAEELKTEGNQLMKHEKYQEAISCYTRAIEMDNTNPVYPCNRAAAYSKIGENKKAVEDCKRALKLDPKYSKAYGRMGLSYQSLGDFANAKESYKKAIEMEPDNAFYKNNLQLVEDKLSQGQSSAGGSMGGAGMGTAAGGVPGSTATGGMPNLGGLDFASLLSNPAVMNMAQSFMQSPQMQQMVASVMQGGAGPGFTGPGGGGNMSSLFQAAQMFGEQLQETNADLMTDLRTQAQSAFNTNGDPEDPNANDQNSQPEEKGDGSGKE